MPTGQKARLDTLIAAFGDITSRAQGKLISGTSGTNTAQTVTIPAPGVGFRQHLVAVLALFSTPANQPITITAQQGGAETLVVQTGAGDQGLILTDIDIVGDDNTTITIQAPAGGGAVTSLVQAIYYTETL